MNTRDAIGRIYAGDHLFSHGLRSIFERKKQNQKKKNIIKIIRCEFIKHILIG